MRKDCLSIGLHKHNELYTTNYSHHDFEHKNTNFQNNSYGQRSKF